MHTPDQEAWHYAAEYAGSWRAIERRSVVIDSGGEFEQVYSQQASVQVLRDRTKIKWRLWEKVVALRKN